MYLHPRAPSNNFARVCGEGCVHVRGSPTSGGGVREAGRIFSQQKYQPREPNILGRKNKLMKNRILSTLAIVALICGTAASCSSDDPAVLTANSALAALIQKDSNLAPASAAQQYANSVTPEEITLSVDDGTATVEEFKALAVAYDIYVYVNGTYDVQMTLFLLIRGGQALYVLDVDGASFVPKGPPAVDIGLDSDMDNAIAVLTENLFAYDPDGDGFFLNDGTDTNALQVGTVTQAETLLTDIDTACPMGTTGSGITIQARLFDNDGVTLDVSMDEVGEGADGTRDVTLSSTDNIPGISVYYDYDCTVALP